MLTVSLHGVRLHAPHGLYPQEHILGNDFEVDVAVHMPVRDSHAQWPFVDYTLLNQVVNEVFQQPGQLLETFVQNIYNELKAKVPDAEKIKVAVRKLHPPMQGDVKYSQVCFEN
jgi:dihydroneopterin aldolase